MDSSIVTIREEVEVNSKKLMLDKDREGFLLDKENPYFSIKNEEKKLLIFVTWEETHYNVLNDNLLYIIKERFPTFIGDIFKKVKGINEYLYNKSYLLYILGEEGKKKWEALQKRFEPPQMTVASNSSSDRIYYTMPNVSVGTTVSNIQANDYGEVEITPTPPQPTQPTPNIDEASGWTTNLSHHSQALRSEIGRMSGVSRSQTPTRSRNEAYRRAMEEGQRQYEVIEAHERERGIREGRE